jgi:hypothetical protein
MTGFGLLFVGYALFHDYWLDHSTNVRFLPYAIIALSFYTGLDVMFAGLAQALQSYRRDKMQALAEAQVLRRELDDLRGQ